MTESYKNRKRPRRTPDRRKSGLPDGEQQEKTRTDRLYTVFEDSHLVVVYKPAGMLSVPYPGSTAKTALSVLTEIRTKTGRVSGKTRPAAVHRLDRETSGLLLFALNASVKKTLMDNWRKLVTERAYIALAEIPSSVSCARRAADTLPADGIISEPLAYNAHHHAYVPKKPDPEAVSAITRYRVLYRGSNYALFRLELETGRKNQIRAHLSHLGYPIAGDEQYRARTNPFGRLALHARTLAFTHPVTGQALRFEIPESAAWKAAIEHIQEG